MTRFLGKTTLVVTLILASCATDRYKADGRIIKLDGKYYRLDNRIEEFVHGGVLLHFFGSMCWRGVWESRIYFPNDSEYWGEELAGMSELWSKHIEPWCKEWIKKKQPDLTYDE